MARLYANENFARKTVEALREFGHDVLTTYESGQANQAISDDVVLAFAFKQQRIILTFNRKHFIKLHRNNQIHAGIVVCTFDLDYEGLATRIHAALEETPDAAGKLFRVSRPQVPDKDRGSY